LTLPASPDAKEAELTIAPSFNFKIDVLILTAPAFPELKVAEPILLGAERSNLKPVISIDLALIVTALLCLWGEKKQIKSGNLVNFLRNINNQAVGCRKMGKQSNISVKKSRYGRHYS
jgi:hypothetical protein